MRFVPRIKFKIEPQKNPKIKTKLIIGFLIILLFLFNLSGVSNFTKNFFYLISSPIQKNLWQSGGSLSNFFEAIIQSKKLLQENKELKSQNSSLLERVARFSELERENRILREAWDLGLKKEFELVVAQVIGKDIQSDSLIIDKGAKDGVVEDSVLITQQRVLVGKVEELYDNFSKVSLIYKKGMNFNVQILSQVEVNEESEKSDEGIYGIAIGEGTEKIILDKVPQSQTIKEGDIIITSNLGNFFPQGLLIGLLKEVNKSDVAPFQKAKVSLLFNLQDLQTLFVIK